MYNEVALRMPSDFIKVAGAERGLSEMDVGRQLSLLPVLDP